MWHHRPGAFERLSPPWEEIEVIETPNGIANGGRVVMQMKMGPVKIPWVAEYHSVREGEQFCDRQVKGPFAYWDHQHRFLSQGPREVTLEDHIRYRLPFGILGSLFGGGFVRNKIERGFAYRHAVTREDLTRSQGESPRTILISGATGMLGRVLVPFLRLRGHRVLRLTRSPQLAGDVPWNPAKGELDEAIFNGVDAVIHLAGEGIAEGRWSDERRQAILNSRVQGTGLIAKAVARMPHGPRVLVCASGASCYPFGDTLHDEDSPLGDSFLAEVVKAWESAADPARKAGIRVVHARLGVVLSPAGGALGKLLPIFAAGLGGPVGAGLQQMSWITPDDVADILTRMAFDGHFQGPVNVVSPDPVSSRQFAQILGHVLRRPTFLPVPPGMLKMIYGQMAEETILADSRVLPTRLQEAGYTWRHPDLETALRHVLGRHEEIPQAVEPTPAENPL